MSQANEFSEAYRLEQVYRWLEAAAKYQHILVSQKVMADKTRDISKIHERIANSYYNAAYQAENEAEFEKLMNAAQMALEKAEATCPTTSIKEVLSCRRLYHARRLYLESLVVSSVNEKKVLLDRSIDEGQSLLRELSNKKEKDQYFDAIEDLLIFIEARIEITVDYTESALFIKKAQSITDEVLKFPLKGDEKPQSIWIRHILSKIISDRPLAIYESVDKQKSGLIKSLENAERAYTSALKIKDASLIGLAAGVLSYLTLEIKGNLETSLQLANVQLTNAKITKNKLQLAQAYELLSYLTSWKTNTIDQDHKTQFSENSKALKLSEEALSLYRLVKKPATIAYLNHVGCYYHLARTIEKIDEKKKILREGTSIAKKDLEDAKDSGSQLGTIFTLNEYVHLLFRSLSLASDEKQKIGIIEEAESIVDELVTLANKVQPFRYWNLSVFKFQFARLKMERANLEKVPQRKKELLLAALAQSEECVKLSRLHLDAHPSKILYLDYAVGVKVTGSLLTQIHAVTNESLYIERSVDAYRETLDIYQKYEQSYRVAEVHWQIASLNNQIGKYLSASKEFDAAAKYYTESSQKLPSLSDFFQDYARYMEAWSQISQAKHYNVQNQYIKVKTHYENAAKLQGETRRWAYLKQNYASWAKLAEAEDLSLREKAAEAKKTFIELSRMFEGSRKIIEEHINSIDIFDEKLMAENIIKASSNRVQYCLGRIALEDARIMENDGDEAASSSKYGEAADTFQMIFNAMEAESERAELAPIIKLCKAWGLVRRAEAESTPIFYMDASKLFEEARDCNVAPDAKTMAQGHSYFCRALYESTQFETNRELESYRSASQFLTLASNCYTKAGYDRAFEYTKAVQRLFDAYIYIDNANGETDPDKKAKFFTLAEKVLGESVRSFTKAKLLKKRAEVRKLLKNIQEERQLALSLAQVFKGPLVSSPMASFNLPNPTHEYPVGLNDFDHANIQATMDLQSLDVNTNNPFDLLFTISNTGKAPATLMRIENVARSKLGGVATSGIYTFKGNNVDLKEKRLPPSTTEEITITINPLAKGEYKIKPRIIYLSDTNESASFELKTIDLKVTDLGLADWLRGPLIKEKTRSKR